MAGRRGKTSYLEIADCRGEKGVGVHFFSPFQRLGSGNYTPTPVSPYVLT